MIQQLHKKQSIWTTIGLCVYIRPLFTNPFYQEISIIYTAIISYIHKKAVNNNLQRFNNIPCVIIFIET